MGETHDLVDEIFGGELASAGAREVGQRIARRDVRFGERQIEWLTGRVAGKRGMRLEPDSGTDANLEFGASHTPRRAVRADLAILRIEVTHARKRLGTEPRAARAQ